MSSMEINNNSNNNIIVIILIIIVIVIKVISHSSKPGALPERLYNISKIDYKIKMHIIIVKKK